MPWVFAYGSLAHDVGGTPARLHGARRAWGVAMDNRRVVPGYKVWLDPADGVRPDVRVAFLDLQAADLGAAVDGVCVEVTGAVLAAVDRRERNYRRIDVTGRVIPLDGVDVGAPVFAYVGTVAARARFRTGAGDGTAVVARPYLAAVAATFGGAIPAPPVPVRRLVRHDVPPPRPRASR